MTVHDEEMMFDGKGLGKSNLSRIGQDMAKIMVAMHPDNLSAVRFLPQLTQDSPVRRRKRRVGSVEDITVENQATVCWQGR